MVAKLKSLNKGIVDRYLGLSLGGAKSDRTALTVIDYYRNQQKCFVVDVFENLGPEESKTADQVIIDLVEKLSTEHTSGTQVLATDAPLTLPPCLIKCDEECLGYEKCKKDEVRWMRLQYLHSKSKNKKSKYFTPYSQRPVELYYRNLYGEVFQDETMGANLAPQASRMQYLKRKFTQSELIEVWPKLVVFTLQKQLKLSRRDVFRYRSLEDGLSIRNKILEKLAIKYGLFIYDRDFKRITHNVSVFDSTLCAWMALLYDLNKVVKFTSDLPIQTGWIQLPEVGLL